MFKRIASDALGFSDIGEIIDPKDYDKVDSDDYIMHEDNEKIYFLIKSKSDEYCFTNVAFIHLDGTSAISKKRLLKRYSYLDHAISDVMLETAGTIDLDAEIKFQLGKHTFSIDVKKDQIEHLKDLYKTLYAIGSLQRDNSHYYRFAERSVEIASSTVHRSTSSTTLETQFKEINQHAFDWLHLARDAYCRKDFGEIFEKYINN
ncbi:PH domain-containing protein [Spartinivicinus poritis]|uniref:PH domain-containing protein n=1 Tax=Spartinivicinus poritis TaxID=2994640 RepID=A0ABT5UIZ7_9GAMM|nr:PH domain-containing protein [Spartinivicinus sp. A2-2]MDE1465403.1 PH domain-containing protein [Spartinivicinus sp. A2-2]